MVSVLGSFPLSFTDGFARAAVICSYDHKPAGEAWAVVSPQQVLTLTASLHQPACPGFKQLMALSAAPSQLSTHQVISLNYHGWPHICNRLHLTTPVFIVLCEGCVGGFHVTTDLTLP